LWRSDAHRLADTARKARKITCPSCDACFPVAEAVERTIVGAPDDRDLRIVRNRAERSD